ncbi:MAG TPA: ATP-binding protein [Candidatus Limnocylindrales bacterium]|nr:ATP-binding protein [Candidatus Limnocylindrales bacterium]
MTDDHAHLATEAIVERLRTTPLFGGLADDQLHRLVEMGEIQDLQPAEFLIREGDEADALYVVLDGELEITKRSDRSEIPVARVGPGALQGEIAALEGGRRLASVRAATAAEVLRIPVRAVRELLSAGPDVALAVIRTAVGRLRGMESTLREREKLAGLGTLAAGLAHELNNPAAAASRAIRALGAAVKAAEERPRPVPPPRPPDGVEPPRSSLDRADRVDELMPLAGSADDAAALVAAGWNLEALRDQPPEVIPWIAADASVHQLLGELSMAVERISEIVGAVKGYAYLDQAPVQRIDVRTGLEQTLVILRHRLREGIEVRQELADDLPEIEAFGSELNQVWTNLVDNAIDAMEGRGTLTVKADRDPSGDGVVVSICDSGPGIPEGVRARLFEPFYTTKPPGKGTGLGLHISHNVVSRHGGRIEVATSEDGTCFEVSLPATLPDAGAR